MSRVATVLSRSAAVLLGALFVLSLSALVLAYGVERTLLSAASYERALDDSAWPHDLFAQVVADSLTRNPPTGVLGRVIRDMDTVDWNAVVAEAAPQDLQRSLVLEAVRGLLGWLQSDAPDLDVTVSLSEIKARLAADPGKQVARIVVLSWPPCTVAQVVDWLVHPSAERLPLCLPPEPQRPLMLSVAEAAVSAGAAQVPDPIRLIDLTNRAGAATPPGLLSLRSSVRWATQMTRVGVLVPLCLLLLVTLLAVRSLKGLLGWWGALATSSGAVVLAASLFVSRAVPALVARLSSGSLPLPQWAAEIANGLAPQIAAQAVWLLQRSGAAMALAGAVVLFAAALVPSWRSRPEGG